MAVNKTPQMMEKINACLIQAALIKEVRSFSGPHPTPTPRLPPFPYMQLCVQSFGCRILGG